ncbi:hypothetical protein LA080_011527 [Diaporthe eres]|nr:hypothetical protein LA080_011527 [Diaporthe eres]
MPPSAKQQQEAYWEQVDRLQRCVGRLKKLDATVRRNDVQLDRLQDEREEALRRGTKHKSDKDRARYIAKWREIYADAEHDRDKAYRQCKDEKKELRVRYQKFQAFRLTNIIGREHGLPQELIDQISHYL